MNNSLTVKEIWDTLSADQKEVIYGIAGEDDGFLIFRARKSSIWPSLSRIQKKAVTVILEEIEKDKN